MIRGYDLTFNKIAEKANDGSGYAAIISSISNPNKPLEGIIYEISIE